MKAVRMEEFGEPEVLRAVEVERPEPGEGQALVEVRAAGVNYADTMRRRNSYLEETPLPFVLGAEVSGTVAEVGGVVEDVAAGDRVVALVGAGGYAEYVVAPVRALIPLPEGLDCDGAAAVPLQGLTAYHALGTMGRLSEGESVLVHAAAGGVGTLAVQMAKLMGAGNVIATASSAEKLDLARSLGADVLVNYAEEDWSGKVREATGERGVDVILEMVGGDFVEKGLSCMAEFGRMVVFGAASGERSKLVPQGLMLKNHTVSGFYLPGVVVRPELLGPSLGEILRWLSEGRLKLTIGGRYPLEEAARAHADLEGRKTTGKLLLIPPSR